MRPGLDTLRLEKPAASKWTAPGVGLHYPRRRVAILQAAHGSE
jgi:hypothetical protein